MDWHHLLKKSHDWLGMQYGLRIFIGTGIVWFFLNMVGLNPLWAVISLIIVTDSNIENTLLNFKFRMVNTAIGYLTGLVFLLFIHHNQLIMLSAALTVAACASAALIRTPNCWRIAAITTAIIIIPSLAESSRMVGMAVAFQRSMEVILGSGVAVLVAWMFAQVKKNISVAPCIGLHGINSIGAMLEHRQSTL